MIYETSEGNTKQTGLSFVNETSQGLTATHHHLQKPVIDVKSLKSLIVLGSSTSYFLLYILWKMPFGLYMYLFSLL
jgi:hypothetical protein